MKLTDDKKTKEDNGILFENCKDIESVSTELKRVVPVEEEEKKEVVSKGKIKMDTNGMSRRYAKDVVVGNGKKIKEEEKKNNFNMDVKEQEKNIKSITEELEKLVINNGAVALNRKLATTTIPKKLEKQKCVELNRASHSLDEIESVNVEKIKGGADRTRSVEDIMAGMDKLGLDSGMRSKDKDLAKSRGRFDMKAFLRDLSAEQVEPDEERLASVNLKTIEIVAQSEKKGEENEDFEETRVLSDACDLYQTDENRCSSFVGRGPFNGVAKDTEHHDLKEMLKKTSSDSHYSDCSQPRKYSRPPMMSGGCVQVVQPDAHVRSLYNVRHLEELNVSAQYPGQMQDSFLCQVNSEVSAEQGVHPYYTNDMKNYNGCQMMQHCPPFYDLRGPVYPPAEDFPGGLEHVANPAYLDHELLGNYTTFETDQGMSGMPYNPLQYYQLQMGSPNVPFPSAHSPYDHCLTSPGSSPPSVLSPYPLSPTSTILTNGDPDLCDLSMLSPGQFSLSSPESGFMTDASRDLDDALEFIEEELAATGKSASLLPLVVESLGSELACEAAFAFAGGQHQSSGNVSQPTKPRKPRNQPKKETKRSPKAAQSASVPEMTSRILPPVNSRVPCTAFYAPSGLSATQLPGTIQIPCFVVEPSRSNQKPTTRPLVPIQPKKNAEPNAQPAIKPAPPTDVSPSAVPRFSPPSTTQSFPQEPTVTSSSDQDQLVKAYRAVAGLPKEQLLGQDDDGDTILHLAIVKEKTKLVKALLERYVREELIDKVINLANKQHQTPLCLAVFLNQTEIVKMLIERKADVNVQLQRKLNGGLKCYRLIHYAASRGKKWVPTLIQLLTADNIDLQAFNSEGCTAMHCAIECHGKHYQQGDEKVDSKDTIYHLAMRGADLNVQHGLCGKTPLHYAIEKKDSDLVGWFLGLASYVQSSGPKQPNGGRPTDLVHVLLNAKTSAGVTALQLALGLQMEPTERIPILKMLLRDGAEVSQKGCDGKLRQELAKFPELAGLLKSGTNLTKNGPR